jgi:hypothetical protein
MRNTGKKLKIKSKSYCHLNRYNTAKSITRQTMALASFLSQSENLIMYIDTPMAGECGEQLRLK